MAAVVERIVVNNLYLMRVVPVQVLGIYSWQNKPEKTLCYARSPRIPQIVLEEKKKTSMSFFGLFSRAMHWSFWLLPVAAWGPFALSLGGKIERMWWKHLIFAVRRCGPVWTKLGQWAACRPDLLPARACRELETLQHRGGQKHSAAETEATLISCLGKEWHKNYSVFEAIGSGVIAQVHRGIRLSDNKALAFKLVHPRVRVQLEQDLIALAAGVSLLETLVPALAEWYDPSGALTQFAKSIRASVSMEKEAANLRRLRTNCGTGVALPEPILSLDNGAHSILIETLEAGLPLAHAIRELTQENMSAEYQTARSVLARRGLHCLLKMLFIDNFCHADVRFSFLFN
mmetsp:Transcript_20810/g.26937  ORF Transcript_20810/g.26937 Transcript_20810/m.26937 type:complete len:345 (+) Transcript_20810:103-1137(+)